MCCLTGPKGDTGPTGVLHSADFYLVLNQVQIDVVSSIAGGASISFPVNGPSDGYFVRDVNNTSIDTFILPDIGKYEILFQVPIIESGQLKVSLDSGAGFEEQDYTTVGATGGQVQLIGMVHVQTTATNSRLRIVNPSTDGPIGLVSFAGGSQAVNAHLLLKRLS